MAIVSPIAGTTRDVLSTSLDLAGVKVVLSDTAGLRSSSSDEVESIGISRATSMVESADLKVLVVPVQEVCYPWTDVGGLLDPELVRKHVDERTLLFFNQMDLMPPSAGGEGTVRERAERVARGVVGKWFGGKGRWCVGSLEEGEGLEEFLEGLEKAVRETYVLRNSLQGLHPQRRDLTSFFRTWTAFQSVAGQRRLGRTAPRSLCPSKIPPRTSPSPPSRLCAFVPLFSLLPCLQQPLTDKKRFLVCDGG